jgi:lysophospholipase L1-like esterase
MKNALLNIVIIAVALLIGLSIAEGGLRVAYPVSHDYTHFVWPPRFTKEFHPAAGVMRGVEGVSRFTVNRAGVRGNEFSDDDQYRILAFGGSVTECLFLDDTETWPRLIQDRLSAKVGGKVWVGNVGMSGLSSRDHLLQVPPLLDQYPAIGAILVMAGVNDMLFRLATGDSYDPNYINTPAGVEHHLAKAFHRIIKTDPGKAPEWYESMALWALYDRYRAAQEAKEKAAAKNEGDDTVRVMRQDEAGNAYVRARELRGAATKIYTLPDLTTALGEFEQNMRTIANDATKRGVAVIFVTHPTLWSKDITDEGRAQLWLGGDGDIMSRNVTRYYAAEVLGEAMDRYNQTLMRVCREADAAFCIDVAASMEKNIDYFYDGVHLSEAGARVVADRVVAAMAERMDRL